jgi:hypothetical protein
MNETIHVELARSCDAQNFVEFLSGRGLAASVISQNDHCEVEVRFRADPAVRLRLEFEAALAQWLESYEYPLIPTSEDQCAYLLRLPSE